MIFLVTVLHVFACVSLIIIVLLQAGKGADIGASMGGAGGQALFGTSSASTMLGKVTTGIAILFMLTSLYLAYMSGRTVNSSVVDAIKPVTETAAPANIPATVPDTPAPADTASDNAAEKSNATDAASKDGNAAEQTTE